MQEYRIDEIENLHRFGRTNEMRCPLTLFWSGSGIEIDVKATELWLEVEKDYNQFEPWISVLVDGAPVSRQMLQKGRYWLPILRNMDSGTERDVKILREVQPMRANPASFLQIHAVRINGEFLPVKVKHGKIEFIGDSLTSGEGTIGAQKEMNWNSMVFSAEYDYAFLTAKLLNADFRIVSQSGWGFLSSWDGDPNCNIPKYYEQVCGVLQGEHNRVLGAFEPYDFSSWRPDVVSVCLGANDAFVFGKPGMYLDEKTGELFEQKLTADGTLEEKSRQRLIDAIVHFAEKIRHCNPDAHIFWIYGLLKTSIDEILEAAVQNYVKNSGDKNLSLFGLPIADSGTMGSREHPGIACHALAAEQLAAEIKKYL